MSRANQLPARYEPPWGKEFQALVQEALFAGMAILDIGAGVRPAIPPPDRPDGTHYTGLDISAEDLRLAPPDAYDETVVSDAGILVPSLVDRFDLIVSRWVLEHVRHVDQAAAVFHQYARPGGRLVARLAGRNALFAIANRVLPHVAAARIAAQLSQRRVERVRPAYYDHCTERGLREAFSDWEEVQIVPHWRAAYYLDRLPLLQRFYLSYENWTANRGMTGLATHYTISARKGN
jgi:SAM-dependent methyltransferase